MTIALTRTIAISLVAFGIAGCGVEPKAPKEPQEKAAANAHPAKKAQLGKHVYLETQGEQRRVPVQAYVCLRAGQLEQFLTRKGRKEHEAILAADVDARLIHAALIAEIGRASCRGG